MFAHWSCCGSHPCRVSGNAGGLRVRALQGGALRRQVRVAGLPGADRGGNDHDAHRQRSRQELQPAVRLHHRNEAKQKISMTTPVFMSGSDSSRTMAFVMPAKMKPRQVPGPAGRFAVLRFSGGRSAKQETDTLDRLKTWMAEQRLSVLLIGICFCTAPSSFWASLCLSGRAATFFEGLRRAEPAPPPSARSSSPAAGASNASRAVHPSSIDDGYSRDTARE